MMFINLLLSTQSAGHEFLAHLSLDSRDVDDSIHSSICFVVVHLYNMVVVMVLMVYIPLVCKTFGITAASAVSMNDSEGLALSLLAHCSHFAGRVHTWQSCRSLQAAHTHRTTCVSQLDSVLEGKF